MLSVCLPGTGGMLPLPGRWLTCCWMEYQGGALLIDCGEGTQIALREAGCKLSRLETILITHFHADHVMGLPGLSSLGKPSLCSSPGPPGQREVLTVFWWCRRCFRMGGAPAGDIARQGGPHHDLPGAGPPGALLRLADRGQRESGSAPKRRDCSVSRSSSTAHCTPGRRSRWRTGG